MRSIVHIHIQFYMSHPCKVHDNGLNTANAFSIQFCSHISLVDSKKSLTIGLNGLYLTSFGLPYITCPFVSIMFSSPVHGCGYIILVCLCMDSYVLIYSEESILNHWWTPICKKSMTVVIVIHWIFRSCLFYGLWILKIH